MNQIDYVELAARGLRMPVGTDLVLHECADRQSTLHDGNALGRVVCEAARRYRTPLAFPLMDLTVEKAAIGRFLGVPQVEWDTFHLTQPVQAETCELVAKGVRTEPTPRMRANLAALQEVGQTADLQPIGMSIGPFSLMTKLIADPITPVFLAASGLSKDDEPEIAVVESALDLAEAVIVESLRHQAAAGARAVFICEPAANIAYFSPNQLAESFGVFERYVIQPNSGLSGLLAELGMDLIFHDCGELIPEMVRHFGALKPAVLSLGSSRKLWEDAALVPKTTVLYGNLPSKRFYSDEAITVAQTASLTCELLERMGSTGHPFILGSECDVLSVPGCEAQIRAKVETMLTYGRGG